MVKREGSTGTLVFFVRERGRGVFLSPGRGEDIRRMRRSDVGGTLLSSTREFLRSLTAYDQYLDLEDGAIDLLMIKVGGGDLFAPD